MASFAGSGSGARANKAAETALATAFSQTVIKGAGPGDAYRMTTLTAKKGNKAEVLVVEEVNALLIFSVAIDVSGSMHGERIEAAKSGLKAVIGAIRDTDCYGLCTFDGKVRTQHKPMARKYCKVDRDMKSLDRAMEDQGGCTALFDAVKESKKHLFGSFKYFIGKEENKDKRVILQHMVITDGSDNSSKANFEDLKRELANPGMPNYNFLLIGVGISDDAEVKGLVSGASHLRYMPVKDADELKTTMQKVADRIRLTLLKMTKGRHGEADSRESFMWEGRRCDAKKALKEDIAHRAPLFVEAVEQDRSLADRLGRALQF